MIRALIDHPHMSLLEKFMDTYKTLKPISNEIILYIFVQSEKRSFLQKFGGML